MSMGSSQCKFNREVVANVALLAIVASLAIVAGQVRKSIVSDKLERYSHEGYLIKVVVMALAGEVTREISPIRSWSNKSYEI